MAIQNFIFYHEFTIDLISAWTILQNSFRSSLSYWMYSRFLLRNLKLRHIYYSPLKKKKKPVRNSKEKKKGSNPPSTMTQEIMSTTTSNCEVLWPKISLQRRKLVDSQVVFFVFCKIWISPKVSTVVLKWEATDRLTAS